MDLGVDFQKGFQCIMNGCRGVFLNRISGHYQRMLGVVFEKVFRALSMNVEGYLQIILQGILGWL